jgi:hypothetical protein
MRKLTFAIICMLFAFATANAQYKFPALDPSPADILYYPTGASHDNLPAKIKIVYSRPSKKGRDVLGGTEPFGKVWRVGANESTEIRFYTNTKLGDKEIPAGNYSLFAIPDKDKWTIIINKVVDRWGAFSYDKTKDVAQLVVPVKPLQVPLESLSMTFADSPTGATLIIGWDKTAVEVPFTFVK